eukprot:CAMPEP_0172932574 /NCGR_PEP_ID=MMETSP1075-20121228/220068_1 /TAXON_ID=2916 /ORGANISM="Ceratium fusus, Strain PA161109" /LENGTH=73 /DNA_ID=CAMNT_0013793903 /DNA_START=32 /DNA_END=253 /DNA_ORIENTATION=-
MSTQWQVLMSNHQLLWHGKIVAVREATEANSQFAAPSRRDRQHHGSGAGTETIKQCMLKRKEQGVNSSSQQQK